MRMNHEIMDTSPFFLFPPPPRWVMPLHLSELFCFFTLMHIGGSFSKRIHPMDRSSQRRRRRRHQQQHRHLLDSNM